MADLETAFWVLLDELEHRGVRCGGGCADPDVKFAIHSSRGYISARCNSCRHEEVATTRAELARRLPRWHRG